MLGPVEMYLDGARLDLGTPKQRALVAALALSSGRPVSVDAIVDLLWGDEPPPGVTATLQAYVSGLRKVLEPQRERRAPATVLVTARPGYALRLPEGAVVESAPGDELVPALTTMQSSRSSVVVLTDGGQPWAIAIADDLNTLLGS